MIGFYIALSIVVLGWGYVIGTLLYHTKWTRVHRMLKMSDKRFIQGEREANDFPERKP